MKENPFSLWVYLSQSPLLWLTVTLLVYAITDAVSQANHRHPRQPRPARDVDYRLILACNGHFLYDVLRRSSVRALLARACNGCARGATL